MPSIDEVVDFLIQEDSLRLGNSPWPTYEEDDDVYQVDWDRFFPPGRPGNVDNEIIFDDDESWQLDDEEFMDKILHGIESGPRPLTGRERGDMQMDICAWYQPIHFYGHDWGIFLWEDCIKKQAINILNWVDFTHWLGSTSSIKSVVRPLSRQLLRASIYAYYLHEHFHHKVESLGFRLHVITGSSCYLAYENKVYRPSLNKDDCLEEALANADAYNRLNQAFYRRWIGKHVITATREYLRDSFLLCPPGYRMAPNYLGNKFQQGKNKLLTQVRHAALKPGQPTKEYNLAPDVIRAFYKVTDNIYTVVPSGKHTCLPSKVPAATCSTSALIKVLQKCGYCIVKGSGKGSHLKLEKSGQPSMILPGNRKDLSPGVIKNILKLLGNYKLHDLTGILSGRINPCP